MTIRPTATQVPELRSWGPRCWSTRSLSAIASEIAPLANSTGQETSATTAARATQPMRVSAVSAAPAATPAGSQATATRRSGWASSPASCWSGRAPLTCGPASRAPHWNSRYSQPTPAAVATTVTATPSAPRPRRART